MSKYSIFNVNNIHFTCIRLNEGQVWLKVILSYIVPPRHLVIGQIDNTIYNISCTT